MKKIIFIAILFFIGITSGFTQTDSIQKGLNTISEQGSQAILTFLASDWMEGRQAGNKGHEIAADYLASMFQLYGLKPIHKLRDPYSIVDNMFFHDNNYFQNFPLYKLKKSDKHELGIITHLRNSIREERF